MDPDGREVIYNSLIDAIVVATQWMVSSQFRRDFKDLKNSNETYVFKGSSDLPANKGGSFSTNGVVLIIEYSFKKDSKGNNCFTDLRHETEHAIQFEYGEIGFDNGGAVNDFGNGVTTPNWNSSGVNADIFDEIKAFDKGYKLSGYNAGKVETSDRHYWNSIEIENKISDMTRTYPRHSTEVRNNSNTSRIQSDTQYMLPYRQRNP